MSKGNNVRDFSFVLFILFIIVAFIGFSFFANEGNFLAGGLFSFVIIVFGKFFTDLLCCIGEIEINTRRACDAIESITKNKDADSLFKEKDFSNEPCFIDWLLEGLKLSKYEKAFVGAGVREYSHFMKLSEEDFKKLGIDEGDIKRLLSTQIRMKVSKPPSLQESLR